MADIDRLLELMHPMREPPAPTAVSPFLFTIALGCVAAGCAYAVWRLLLARRAGLRRSARLALAASRGLGPPDRLAAQAALLRRLVRRVAGEAAARSQGPAWLATLDATFATRFFTSGAGTAYGDSLYARSVPDVDALDRSLDGLIAALPSRRRATVGAS